MYPSDQPEIFGERATIISLDDEGAGEFLVIKQQADIMNANQTLRIDPEEWEYLKKAVNELKKLSVSINLTTTSYGRKKYESRCQLPLLQRRN